MIIKQKQLSDGLRSSKQLFDYNDVFFPQYCRGITPIRTETGYTYIKEMMQNFDYVVDNEEHVLLECTTCDDLDINVLFRLILCFF